MQKGRDKFIRQHRHPIFYIRINTFVNLAQTFYNSLYLYMTRGGQLVILCKYIDSLIFNLFVVMLK